VVVDEVRDRQNAREDEPDDEKEANPPVPEEPRADDEALRAEIAERPLPVAPPPTLRPMRCAECAAPLPLDREGQLRICPACRRAFLIDGRRLLPVTYEAEPPPSPRGRFLVPAWRIAFVLEDPRDGRELASVAAVLARCGETGVEMDGPAPLDVPAFLPTDKRRERHGAQRLPSLPSASFPLFEGPARGEAGFPEPRLVLRALRRTDAEAVPKES